MKYQFDQTAIIATWHNDRTVSFMHEGKLHFTLSDANIDFNCGDIFYSAALYVEDEEGEPEQAGGIRWNIIDADCEDQSTACNWEKFDVYM